jgi:GNAT superfamily N-acetyltransferase
MLHAEHVMTRGVPTTAEVDFLEDRLYEHNRAKTGRDDGELFGIFIRNAQQEIVAGISGWTWAQACEIRELWVDDAWRGQGYGKTLLEAAEENAREHGCKVILLQSFSFQAPGFYQKCGYELVWKLDDFPPDYHYCYLIKRFPDSES